MEHEYSTSYDGLHDNLIRDIEEMHRVRDEELKKIIHSYNKYMLILLTVYILAMGSLLVWVALW